VSPRPAPECAARPCRGAGPRPRSAWTTRTVAPGAARHRRQGPIDVFGPRVVSRNRSGARPRPSAARGCATSVRRGWGVVPRRHAQ
jgi:hypothetical protein